MDTLPGNYTIRPVTEADESLIFELLVEDAVSTGHQLPDPGAIRTFLQDLQELLPEFSQLALRQDGKPAGYAIMIPYQLGGKLEVQIESGFQTPHEASALASRLFEWVHQKAEAYFRRTGLSGDIRMRVSYADDRRHLEELYKGLGFQPFITQIRMQRDLSKQLPVVHTPDHVEMRHFQEKDNEAMRQVFNEAFRQHWIGELSPEAWQERFVATRRFQPDLTFLAWFGDTLAGFSLSEHDPARPAEGWLEVMAVLPAFRRRGLGWMLLTYTLQRYSEAGFLTAGLDVDLENQTEAIRLYERAGFSKVKGTRYSIKITSIDKD